MKGDPSYMGIFIRQQSIIDKLRNQLVLATQGEEVSKKVSPAEGSHNKSKQSIQVSSNSINSDLNKDRNTQTCSAKA